MHVAAAVGEVEVGTVSERVWKVGRGPESG